MKRIYPHKSLMTAALLSVMLLALSCKKLVDVPPPTTSISSADVFNSDATAISAVTNIYSAMSNSGVQGGLCMMNLFPGLSADELAAFNTGNALNTAYYTDNLTNSDPGSADFWSAAYPVVYQANAAIEGLSASGGLTPAVKQQLLGEAYFMRAFCYFYLVNLYGDVPLALSSNYKVNELLPRTPAKQVYSQLIADLVQAQSLLSTQFLDGTVLNSSTDRARPSRWAATALLARAYLYYDNLTGATDYSNAAAQASLLISQTGLFSLSSLNTAFLRASSGNNEAIWQLQPVLSGQNTPDAWLFILPSSGPSSTYPFYLNTDLVNSFENGDQRRVDWIDSVTVSSTIYYYVYKYKSATLNAPVTEYETVFRLAEQYLIRAEAAANDGSSSAALNDINVIRQRAGLPDYSGATDKASLLTEILHQRQDEFFTEWGHRWLDLKRAGTVDEVMSIAAPQKGGTWSSCIQ